MWNHIDSGEIFSKWDCVWMYICSNPQITGLHSYLFCPSWFFELLWFPWITLINYVYLDIWERKCQHLPDPRKKRRKQQTNCTGNQWFAPYQAYSRPQVSQNENWSWELFCHDGSQEECDFQWPGNPLGNILPGSESHRDIEEHYLKNVWGEVSIPDSILGRTFPKNNFLSRISMHNSECGVFDKALINSPTRLSGQY